LNIAGSNPGYIHIRRFIMFGLISMSITALILSLMFIIFNWKEGNEI